MLLPSKKMLRKTPELRGLGGCNTTDSMNQDFNIIRDQKFK
jgi:hypothetical protein